LAPFGGRVAERGEGSVPIVFVHGVATRLAPKYWRDIAARKKLTEAFLYEPLGLEGAEPPRFAYWGEYGATFRWGHGSLPSSEGEAFGETEDALAEVIGEHADLATGDDASFVTEVARRSSFEEAVDLLFVAAAQEATSQQAEDLASLARALAPWLGQDRAPAWLGEAADDIDFLTRLAAEFPSATEEEGFGSREDAWPRLRERLSRIRTAVPAATGRVAGGALRPRVNDQFATFVGDVLVYLERAGANGARNGILEAVAGEIEAAGSERTEVDPLVVIAHSMGGNIVYDLFSHYRTDLSCDTLVTVGSQVGLFQELDLFADKHPGLRPPQKVPRLENVGRWINVYDRNDFLGFAAARIFDGVDDFEYPTGKGLLKAHSSYFVRPSFYSRLAARLKG
jgi:pimeloyl-ACP methyl ester carboxylesterase